MGAFSSFANRLPDPAYGVDEAGQNVNSTANYGPGFASVRFEKEQPTMMSRTNSGRVVTRSLVGETLKIGKSGYGVKELQIKLGIKPTGFFDKNLETIVQSFQKKNNLKPDGIVGKITYNILGM